jgi:uncharacterized membrane protein YozB (DUF420 family)
MDVYILPAVNATLNGVSAILLFIGHRFIKTGNRRDHKWMMIAAFSTSILFLISYLYYHAHVGDVSFKGTGIVRPFYFTILISHILLAAAIVPLAIITLLRGLSSKFDKHRRIARWTYPIWMYVSVTGVVVYLMVYQLYR